MLTAIVCVLAGYLLGSIPSAYLLTRALAGKDIRLENDGNVGARNALRVAGPVAALLTLSLDVGKGAAASLLAQSLTATRLPIYLAGVAVILGHGFPIWLRWHGGKGLAAAAGYLLALWPADTIIALMVLLAVRAVRPVFDLAVAAAAVTFLLLSIWQRRGASDIVFFVSLMVLTGVKKLIDRPRETILLSGGRSAVDSSGRGAGDQSGSGRP